MLLFFSAALFCMCECECEFQCYITIALSVSCFSELQCHITIALSVSCFSELQCHITIALSVSCFSERQHFCSSHEDAGGKYPQCLFVLTLHLCPLWLCVGSCSQYKCLSPVSTITGHGGMMAESNVYISVNYLPVDWF